MCEMMDPSTSKPVRLECAGDMNDIQSIKDQLWTKIKKFILTVIGEIVTYQSFSTYYPNEVITPPFLFDSKPHKI